MMIPLLFVAAAVCGAGPDLLWKNGVPPPLSPDNPYLPALNTFPGRAMHLLRQGKPEHPFFLVWGAAGPGSAHRANRELRDLALAEFERITLERERKPAAFWDIIGDLEALLLWQNEGSVPKGKIAEWQRRLRPSVEANVAAITDAKSWVEWAANTLLQSSAILELAAASYGRENPSDPAIARWRSVARENLRKALAIQLPGGAFSYIRHSGPDPVYFAFDAAHLGRYYQLTGDRSARAALVRMAEWGGAATVCGWITPFSSPWWKHVVGPGGPYTGPETLATLAGLPAMRGVMAKRRGYIQPYFWSYGNMYGWAPPDGPAAPIADRCGMDRNANGPALRSGGWDVEMPARPWGDSLFGASFSTESAIRSCVNAVYLAANLRNGAPAERHGQNAYIMLSERDVRTHSGIAGDGWIAGAGSFAPHLGLCGEAAPETSPWQRTDVWFADADGAAGMLELECRAAETVRGIEVMAGTNAGDVELAPGKVVFKDFTLSVEGADLGPPAVGKGHTFFAYIPLAGAGARAYRPGEVFRVRAALARPGRPVISAANASVADGLHRFDVLRDGALRAHVAYNAAPVSRSFAAPWAGTLFAAAGTAQARPRPTAAGRRIVLRPAELAVLR